VKFGSQNANLDIRLGETNVDTTPAVPQNQHSLGIVGLHSVGNTNTTLTNNDGLFSVPIRVPGGTVGNFSVSLAVNGDLYSGFANTAGDSLTNQALFPHVNNIIEVRNSRRGDTDGNLAADSRDLPGFISALQNINTFQASRPWLQAKYITDFNQDNAVDSRDIPGLIAAFQGSPSPTAVPEPGTVGLAIAGSLALLAGRQLRRRKVT
jgi:hypothetical protein